MSTLVVTLMRRYRGRGFWFSPPSVQYISGVSTITPTEPSEWPDLPSGAQEAEDSWNIPFPSLQDIYDVPSRLSTPMAEYYRTYIRKTLERETRIHGRKFGALVMEPVCLGAGGMVFVDPLFQTCLVEVVRSGSDLFSTSDTEGYSSDLSELPSRDLSQWRGLPVIYDEGQSSLYISRHSTWCSILRTLAIRLLLSRFASPAVTRHLSLCKDPDRRSTSTLSDSGLIIDFLRIHLHSESRCITSRT